MVNITKAITNPRTQLKHKTQNWLETRGRQNKCRSEHFSWYFHTRALHKLESYKNQKNHNTLFSLEFKKICISALPWPNRSRRRHHHQHPIYKCNDCFFRKHDQGMVRLEDVCLPNNASYHPAELKRKQTTEWFSSSLFLSCNHSFFFYFPSNQT